MAYTYLLYHIVIRTKANRPVIPEEHEKMLYAYIWGICKEKEYVLHRINGMPDHIHMLVEFHLSIAISDFVREMKKSTNLWMKHHKDEFPYYESWRKSYCALSYSERDKNMVKDYIANQKEHHKVVSFKEEYEAMLREFGLEPDQWLLADL